jgi:hypothetical protein
MGVWTRDSAQRMKFGVGVASETVRKYKDGCLEKTIGFQKRLSPSALNNMNNNETRVLRLLFQGMVSMLSLATSLSRSKLELKCEEPRASNFLCRSKVYKHPIRSSILSAHQKCSIQRFTNTSKIHDHQPKHSSLNHSSLLNHTFLRLTQTSFELTRPPCPQTSPFDHSQ